MLFIRFILFHYSGLFSRSFSTGEDSQIELMLMKRMVLPGGVRFTLRNQGVTVGTGVVTEVLSDATDEMLKARWRRLS